VHCVAASIGTIDVGTAIEEIVATFVLCGIS